MKINLGCGKLHKQGYINADIVEPADVLFDVEMGIPYKDNNFERVEADNVIEHIGDKFIFVMNEIYRVLEKEGEFWIKVPDAENWFAGAFGDPTHKRFFCLRSFNYFNREHPTYLNYGGEIKGWKIKELKTDNKFITATLIK